MSDLFSLLSVAASSLQAHRAQSSTASHNLANANTAGFSRQRATLEATLPADRLGGAFLGRGASLGAISRATDPLVEAQLPGALAAQARSAAAAQALSGLNALDPEGGAGLTDGLFAFYAAGRALASAPADPGSRAAFVAAAQQAALAFQTAGRALDGARDGVDARLSALAQRATGLAASAAALNAQIQVERAGGAEPNDLLDARARAVHELAQLTGAQVVPDSDGNLNLVLSGGGALVTGGVAGALGTVPDPANGGHLALTVRGAGAPTAAAVASSAFGGEAGGLLDARDGALADAEAALDTLAFDWATAVNTAHRAGFGLDGVSGRDLFAVGAQAAGAASTLAVDPAISADPRRVGAAASAATVPGDGKNLAALVQTERQALSSGLGPFEALAAAIAGFGAAVDTARVAEARDGAVAGQLSALQQSVAGVSIDEELVALTASQRSYEAVLQVVKTADEMLQTLLQLR